MKNSGYNEYKIWLNSEETNIATALLGTQMQMDEHCTQDDYYNVYDMYYDSRVGSNSPEGVDERLRIRTYDASATPDSPVSIELIQKFGDTVSKSTLSLPYYLAMSFINHAQSPDDIYEEEKDVASRIAGFLKGNNVTASSYISAKRRAYNSEEHNLRVCFDTDVLHRDIDVDLYSGDYGMPVLEENCYIMTIKHIGELPVWFEQILMTLSTIKARRTRIVRKFETKKLQRG